MNERETEGQRLVAALTAAGFVVAGRGRGYVRMGWPEDDSERHSLLIPMDDTAPEFAEMLATVKAQLRHAARRGEAAEYALSLHRMEAAS